MINGKPPDYNFVIWWSSPRHVQTSSIGVIAVLGLRIQVMWSKSTLVLEGLDSDVWSGALVGSDAMSQMGIFSKLAIRVVAAK